MKTVWRMPPTDQTLPVQAQLLVDDIDTEKVATARLTLREASFREAAKFIARWHSRLPKTAGIPASYVFMADCAGTPVAAAMWGNTSARDLPVDWLELRRMAVRTDGIAPHCTASQMLGLMRRSLKVNAPYITRLISYQDVDVHTGTIYKAANWSPAYYSKPRQRRRDTGLIKRRVYRTDSNGAAVAAAGKIRWELVIRASPALFPKNASVEIGQRRSDEGQMSLDLEALPSMSPPR